jgi:hypothetical protein
MSTKHFWVEASHFMCQNHTQCDEITFLSLKITTQRDKIKVINFKIALVCVKITLISIKSTLNVTICTRACQN